MPDDIVTIADLTLDPDNARRHAPSNLAMVALASRMGYDGLIGIGTPGSAANTPGAWHPTIGA